MPTASAHSSAFRAGMDRSTPRASITSAAPAVDEAPRFPCLTIRAPAPAATSEDIVERFTVPRRSPPVPTTSRVSPGTCTGFAACTIASVRPRSSGTVTPLAARARRNPPTCPSVASPAIISPMAHAATSSLRSSPRVRARKTSGQEVPRTAAVFSGVLTH